MMIRLSEIEIDSIFLQEYKNILQEESRASVQLEPGVIAIYPMYQKENPTQIRILEIYEKSKSVWIASKNTSFSEIQNQYPQNGKIAKTGWYGQYGRLINLIRFQECQVLSLGNPETLQSTVIPYNNKKNGQYLRFRLFIVLHKQTERLIWNSLKKRKTSWNKSIVKLSLVT